MRTDNKLFAAAVRRYARDCERMGAIYQQPNNWLCRIYRGTGTDGLNAATVTLANENGKLAIYQFRGEPLRMLRTTRAA